MCVVLYFWRFIDITCLTTTPSITSVNLVTRDKPLPIVPFVYNRDLPSLFWFVPSLVSFGDIVLLYCLKLMAILIIIGALLYFLGQASHTGETHLE